MRMTAIGGALLGATILLFTGLHVEIHVRPGLLDALQEPQPSRQQTPTPPFVTSGEPTDATMRNVDFHIDQGIVLRIRHLLGQMHGRGGVVDFDNVSSYTMDVESAVVGMRGSDLTTLMNRYVFNYRGAPITNLRVEITPQGVRQTGTLHKGVAIPFDMTAAPSVAASSFARLACVSWGSTASS